MDEPKLPDSKIRGLNCAIKPSNY